MSIKIKQSESLKQNLQQNTYYQTYKLKQKQSKNQDCQNVNQKTQQQQFDYKNYFSQKQKKVRNIKEKRIVLKDFQLIIKYDNGFSQIINNQNSSSSYKVLQQQKYQIEQYIQLIIIDKRQYVIYKKITNKDILLSRLQCSQKINYFIKNNQIVIPYPKIDQIQSQKLKKQYKKYLINYVKNFSLQLLFQHLQNSINQFSIGKSVLQDIAIYQNQYPHDNQSLIINKSSVQNKAMYNLKFKTKYFYLFQIYFQRIQQQFGQKHLHYLFQLSSNQPSQYSESQSSQQQSQNQSYNNFSSDQQSIQIKNKFNYLRDKRNLQKSKKLIKNSIYRIPGSFLCKYIYQNDQKFLQVTKIKNPKDENNFKLEQFILLSYHQFSKNYSFNLSKYKNFDVQCPFFFEFKMQKCSGSMLCGIVSDINRANQLQSASKSMQYCYYGLRTGNSGFGGLQQKVGKSIKQGSWVKLQLCLKVFGLKIYQKQKFQDEYTYITTFRIYQGWGQKEAKLYFNIEMSRIGDKIKILI